MARSLPKVPKQKRKAGEVRQAGPRGGAEECGRPLEPEHGPSSKAPDSPSCHSSEQTSPGPPAGKQPCPLGIRGSQQDSYLQCPEARRNLRQFVVAAMNSAMNYDTLRFPCIPGTLPLLHRPVLADSPGQRTSPAAMLVPGRTHLTEALGRFLCPHSLLASPLATPCPRAEQRHGTPAAPSRQCHKYPRNKTQETNPGKEKDESQQPLCPISPGTAPSHRWPRTC